jgi:hypothetical protein
MASWASNLRRVNATPELYEQLFSKQGGVCRICGEGPKAQRRLCIDHDHGTGQVRGLLCIPCNSGIGKLKDDPALLERAIEYLRGKL